MIKKFRSNIFFVWFFIGILIIAVSCDEPQTTDYEVEIFSESYQRNVETLASDVFEGRAPTTPGGKKTKALIESEFRRLGLKPANGESYRQAVPLVEINGSNFSELLIRSYSGDSLVYQYMDEMMVGSSMLEDSIALKESELVFAGYGIVAPEYGWNDYKGLDVEGKTVVVLVNDPGYELLDDTIFTGKAMTYYGRWTYKYEEAARQGAAGAIIVHETGPAGYGWDVVRNSWSGPQYQVGGSREEPVLQVEGWVQREVAQTIFQTAGLSLEEAKEMALNPDFELLPLGLNASVSLNNEYVLSESYNIVAYVEGSEYPEESVVYMAHWDHLGKEKTPDGTKIYNGAIDNATGTAAIMAIAEKFSAMDPPPKRSVVFLAVTAEESGLIGSQYYSQNPLFSLEKTAGGINIDGLNVYGPTHDVSVIGYSTSEFQQYLKRHAAVQDRILVPEKYPERGYFYRSDHFNLVKQGVPMIYANSGEDFIDRDEEYSRWAMEDMEQRYHSPQDVIHDKWDWRGLHQNLWLFYNVGKELANSDDWPEWNEGTEFKTIRDASADQRQKAESK